MFYVPEPPIKYTLMYLYLDGITSHHTPSNGFVCVWFFADAGWLLYKAAEKAKTPDTSFVLTVRRASLSYNKRITYYLLPLLYRTPLECYRCVTSVVGPCCCR